MKESRILAAAGCQTPWKAGCFSLFIFWI